MCVDNMIDTAWACCQKTGAGANWCNLAGHWYDVRKEFCDERDGTHYKFTTIARKSAGLGGAYVATWMAENLNFSQNVPEDQGKCREDNCATYGRFYTWEAAMSYCPDGWHLPTQAEFDALIDAVGKTSTAYKASGSNTSGFSALQAGYIDAEGNPVGTTDTFWSTTEKDATHSYRLYVGASVYTTTASVKTTYRQVRCVKD